MIYRDPETGRFITREQWESLQEEVYSEFDDWEDFEDFEHFDEEEYGEPS
jgi:hypothetical protein